MRVSRVMPLLLSAVAVAAGCDRGTPRIEVAAAEARLSPMLNGAAAIFAEIRNAGDGRDDLVAVRLDLPGAVAELHDVKDGRMVKADDVRIPAGGVVALRPGGLHVMVFRLPRDVAPGAELPVRLAFRRSGEVRVTARVLDRETSGGNVARGGPSGRREGTP